MTLALAVNPPKCGLPVTVLTPLVLTWALAGGRRYYGVLLVAGLREQERMRDLFGRHVGADVARQALEYGASLLGDVREVTALFVTSSTRRRWPTTPPEELVGQVNGLFASVWPSPSMPAAGCSTSSRATRRCASSAPTRLADPASAALSAARTIRDAVRELGELDLGIGVASSPVFSPGNWVPVAGSSTPSSATW
jgi:adenylate cyclase